MFVILCMAYPIEPINSNHLKTWLFSSTKSFIMKNNWRCSICEKPNRKYVSKHIRYNSFGYKERKYNTLIFYHYIIARSFLFCIFTYILFSTTRHENYFDMLDFFYVSLNIKRKKTPKTWIMYIMNIRLTIVMLFSVNWLVLSEFHTY